MIPEQLPDDMQKVVNLLKKCRNKTDCLGKTYAILSKKYRGYKFRTFFHWGVFFTHDLENLWGRSGFLYCTNLNYVLTVLLVKSGWFNESDIKKSWTSVYFISPHQYLNVRIDLQHTVNVDLWANAYGIMLGDHAYGLHV